MSSVVIAEAENHKNILLDNAAIGAAVQANQHLIIHGGESLLLDPGGTKTFRRAYPETLKLLKGADLTHLFLSHQDPDIVAAANGWLVSTNAKAHISRLWVRFVAHFGLDKLTTESMVAIEDEGTIIKVGGAPMYVLPAHHLHSVGNFQLYDPITKVLYSGDLGASLGQDYDEVTNFDTHEQYMAGFHRRYMGNAKAMSLWASMARQLDIEIIAPQHGALFRGKAMVDRFIDWCDGFPCGTDLLEPVIVPEEIRK